MSTFLRTSGRTGLGAGTSSGGRNYDYTEIYPPPDEPTENGIDDNARVWNVYLDEAENYDADMIRGFQDIIDSLLVFAALFSAVVTTFVAQTSQALQPDKSQVTIALLSENNQLLRAAGNKTIISVVPTVSLDAESRSYTSTDVWVNGLFFTSLALSLSTALLSVLAKQWIQAYTAIVPGSARTRALIRHFRFQGLTKWHLGDIIESLPLILHSSVAIFLVGLALYVVQLSHPICVIVSVITALTFLFYLGTSVLPAFDIACPYRIPFMFWLARPLSFGVGITKYAFLRLCQQQTKRRPQMPKQSLKMTENNKVDPDQILAPKTSRLACDSLDWLFDLSSNQSVKQVVVEGACSLLHNLIQTNLYPQLRPWSKSNNLILSTITYSLSRLPYTSSSITEEKLKQSTYANLIENTLKISRSKSLLNGPITGLKDNWRQGIERSLTTAYQGAIMSRSHVLSRHILDWGHPDMILPQSTCGRYISDDYVKVGDEEDIRDLVDRGLDLKNWRDGSSDSGILHCAVHAGNLPGVKALVGREPSLIFAEATFVTRDPKTLTPLDLAIDGGRFDMVAYLLDAGAKPSSYALHITVLSWKLAFDVTKQLAMVKFLLDHGWDRTVQNANGRVPADLARMCLAHNRGHDTIVEHLENYQTVRHPPYATMSLSLNVN